jgi:hypothetical protein
VSAASGQAGQTLSKGRIQAFDQRRIQLCSSGRRRQQSNRLKGSSLGQASNDLDHALFGGLFDHRPNHDFGPGEHSAASPPRPVLDLFAERSPDTARIGRPAISQDQECHQGLATGFD